MEINTSLMKIIFDINKILSPYEKPEFIRVFKNILLESKLLLKTDSFDFWIKQIDEIELEEIPVTKFGVEVSKVIWKNVQNIKQTLFHNNLMDTCELLLTFCDDKDQCEKNSPFHYYYHIPQKLVFKESELGETTLKIAKNQVKIDQIRIAKISELDFEKEKFL
jgi:hypothetical protein